MADKGQERFRISKTINLGEISSIALVLLAVISYIITINDRLTILERQQLEISGHLDTVANEITVLRTWMREDSILNAKRMEYIAAQVDQIMLLQAEKRAEK